MTGKTYNEIIRYIQEIENDVHLKKHIQEMTKNSLKKFVSDSEARHRRRIGWYAFVRALKPKIVSIHK